MEGDQVTDPCSAMNKHGYREQLMGAEALEGLRFTYMTQQKVPWKPISLALFLLLLCTLLLVVSNLSHMHGDNSQAYSFLLLAILLFLPGFYETKIAYYSWRGCRGYTFSRVPVHYAEV